MEGGKSKSPIIAENNDCLKFAWNLINWHTMMNFYLVNYSINKFFFIH